jgi:hypothetical protein
MKKHPLEELWNTTAWDILSAIQRGFRAQVDVKGKLAEWFLFQRLEKMEQEGALENVDWTDKDGQPDFVVTRAGREIKIECKNVRSPGKAKRPQEYARVELQKTRNSKEGEPTRGYKPEEFDVLAACLFNSTRKWEYLFVATRRLTRRPKPLAQFLTIMQPVPLQPEGFWSYDLFDALKDAIK